MCEQTRNWSDEEHMVSTHIQQISQCCNSCGNVFTNQMNKRTDAYHQLSGTQPCSKFGKTCISGSDVAIHNEPEHGHAKPDLSFLHPTTIFPKVHCENWSYVSTREANPVDHTAANYEPPPKSSELVCKSLSNSTMFCSSYSSITEVHFLMVST